MLTVPVEFAVLVILLRPLLLFLTLPLNALTLGLPSLLFNALILKWTADVNATLVVTSYSEALLGAVVMTVCETDLEKGRRRIETSLAKAVAKGKLEERRREAILGRIRGVVELGAGAPNVPEVGKWWGRNRIRGR